MVDRVSKLIFPKNKTTIRHRLATGICELCEKSCGTHEIHHASSLKELKGNNAWEKIMLSKRRKTLMVCVECHKKIHS